MTDDRHDQQSAQRAAPVARVARHAIGDGGDIPLGAHLVTSRRSYSHHGIHVGAGRVVHYAGFSSGLHRGPVEEVPLAEFADGRPVHIKCAANARYSGAEVAARARSRLGEDRYRLTTNNCEHFCEWCVHGESRSEQVDSIFSSPRRTLAFALALCHQLVSENVGQRRDDACAV